MSIWIVLSVLISLILYITFVLIYIHNHENNKKLEVLINESQNHSIKTFYFENKLLEALKAEPNKIKTILYIERFLLISSILISFWLLKGLAILAFGAIIIMIVAEDSYKKVVYESGITNINKIINFINYFVPHINSGNSADQSLLGYIEYAGDEELSEYYHNRDNVDFKLAPHLKQIVDIYDIAKYNEEQGISDYTYILNELSQDMAQKQVYYNNFISRIGEIQPIMWSYYIGVPILIFISFEQTASFWRGIGGYLVSIALLIFFGVFKFLIFKLQKNTINVIF